MTKRALVIGPGGLRGAYDGGVASVLGKHLPADYFDSVYGSSVGVFTASYFVARQFSLIERIWSGEIDWKKMASVSYFLHLRRPLNLAYVKDIFSKGNTKLDKEAIRTSQQNLHFVLSENPSGLVSYPRVNEKDVLLYAVAATAMPFIHAKVCFDEKCYNDVGSVVDPLPVQRALDDGHDEIVAIYNKHVGFEPTHGWNITNRMMFPFMPSAFRDMYRRQLDSWKKLEKLLAGERRIKVIRPKEYTPVTKLFDTNSEHIQKTVDLGIVDGKVFLKKEGFLS